MAGHAKVGVVVAAIDGQSAGEGHFVDLVPFIGQHVGMAIGACIAVFYVGGRRGFSGSEVFRQAIGAMAARTYRGYFFILIPVVKRLAVPIEVTNTHFDSSHGFRLRLARHQLRCTRRRENNRYGNQNTTDIFYFHDKSPDG